MKLFRRWREKIKAKKMGQRIYDHILSIPRNAVPLIKFSLGWESPLAHPSPEQILDVYITVLNNYVPKTRHHFPKTNYLFSKIYDKNYSLDFFVEDTYIFACLQESKKNIIHYGIFIQNPVFSDGLEKVFYAWRDTKNDATKVSYCIGKMSWVKLLFSLYHKPCSKPCWLCDEIKTDYKMDNYSN